MVGLGSRCGLSFESQALERIYSITGGHPWLLRKLGSKIHREDPTRSAVKSVTRIDVDRVFQRTRRAFFSHVDWIVNHLKDVAPEEFKLLKDIAQGGEERYWDEWRDVAFRETFAAHLEAYGLVTFEGDIPAIGIELVKDALIAPIAQVFPEQKVQLREAADSLEATIRIRLITDLSHNKTVAEAVEAVVSAIPKEAKNRPKTRDQLRELGLEAGMRALVESLNWGDYMTLMKRLGEEVGWAANSLTLDDRLSRLDAAIELLHLARHNNDAELKRVIAEKSYESVYRQVREANDLLVG